jgi:TonB family protein
VTARATPGRVFTNTRRVPRFPLSVPADVTVLRSGIPFSIPGRSVSLGERGVGLVLAGELREGDSVGIEFRLPNAGGPFRLKAIVRYQALLHCGLEFVSLTSEQQTLIEHWARKKAVTDPAANASTRLSAPPWTAASKRTAPARSKRDRTFRRVASATFLLAVLVAGGFAWWHWHRAWGELEAQIPAGSATLQQPPPTVPAETMEKLLTHRVLPIYPEAARRAHIQGVVVLDTTIASDGTVLDVRPVSGPDELTTAAVDAVKWWRFQPYLVNGQAAQVRTTLAVDFRGN